MSKTIKLNPAQAWICNSNKRQVWTTNTHNKLIEATANDLSTSTNLFIKLNTNESDYELEESFKMTNRIILSTIASILLTLFSILFLKNEEYSSFFYSSALGVFSFSNLILSLLKNEKTRKLDYLNIFIID